MFEKLTQTVQTLADRCPPVDPSRFGDPIALETDWTPVPAGGPSGDKLVEVSPSRLEYRASLQAKAAFLVFLLTGLGLLVGFPVSRLSAGTLSFDKNTIVPMLIGLVLSAAGVYLLYFGTAPVVFDKLKGLFWKGRTTPEGTAGNGVSLADVHALQVISEYCSGPKTPAHYRYHVNLVLKDGRRFSVVVHGAGSKAREEASVLSRFLGRPVWDAT